jgi:hypothetical protein
MMEMGGGVEKDVTSKFAVYTVVLELSRIEPSGLWAIEP